MNSRTIIKIVTKLAELDNVEFDKYALEDQYSDFQEYDEPHLGAFNDDLIEKAYSARISLVRNAMDKDELRKFLAILEHPIIVYQHTLDRIRPLIVYKKGSDLVCYDVEFNEIEEIGSFTTFINSLRTFRSTSQRDRIGKVIVLMGFPLEYIGQNEEDPATGKPKKVSAVKRFFSLLHTERKDISFIYIYAVAIGLINLSLPLGIQAIIGLISGGMIFNSVILLIALVVTAILIAGGLQIMQVTLVEILQRRVFARTAIEIGFRLPRVTYEALAKYYPPELMNRFFDVLTVQKGLPKILIDLTAAVLTIIFGIIVLAFYHPFFLIFGFSILFFIVVIFYFTGPRGLNYKMTESDYKYKVAHWLEELARNIQPFKLAGKTELPIQKTDSLVGNYLYYRRKHFGVLITQFISLLAFKVLVTGGLLAIGTLLVVEREITLGQFVASEVIIITIVSSIEKIFGTMDTIYDLLVGMAKLGKITDLPLEKQQGLKLSLDKYDRGLKLDVKDLSYSYPSGKGKALNNLNFTLDPAESMCIVGTNGSGKSTLVQIISGVLETYTGSITINDINLRDLDLTTLRDSIEKMIDNESIFEGTILENIAMGRSHINFEDVVWACNNLGISDEINNLPKGYHTQMVSAGKGYSTSFLNKICLARNIADRPKMIIIDDFLQDIDNRDKVRIVNFLLDKQNPWTLICMTNDPFLMSACDKILLLDKGQEVAFGTYKELRGHPVMIECAYHD